MDPLDRARDWLTPMGLDGLCDLDINPGWLVFPVLLFTTGTMLIFLLLSKSFDNRRLWNLREARRGLRRVLLLFLPFALVMAALAYVLAFHTEVMSSDQFFGMPRRSPKFMLIILIAYPVFSAFPQEITHRAFFFHRYEPILPGRWTVILLNAFAFMWLHVLFWNWIALALTLGGGLLMAYTYERSRSTLLAGVEHALYGNWAFATGLGWFVYTGSVGA
ncbi:MAG: membrane protease YdiL (CAAX protease family) [Phycisphaerales bacterium]|jgi:membrane protease YdiL (CAAX protease family)